MIGRVLRWLAGLDRSYFLALSAFIAAIIAALFVAFAPTVELLDGSAMTLIEDSGAGVIVLILLPVLVLGAPLIALPQAPGPRRKNDKINSVASTGVLLAFTVAFLPWLGVFYMPAVILSVASSVSLYFGRGRRPAQDTTARPAGARGEDGVRLSRSAKKRARQEAAGRSGEAMGETPLASSRRRRGRTRKRP